MGVSIRPKSIRGKLLLAFILALAPMLGVELCCEFGSRSEALMASSILSDMLWHGSASFVGVVVLFVVGNRLARPIHRLAHAASAIAVGDFRRRVSVETGDELQVLGDAFNKLGDSLVEHEAGMKAQAEMLAGMLEAARAVSSSLDVKQTGKAIAGAMCGHLGASDAIVYRKNDIDGGARVIGRLGNRFRVAWKRLGNHATDSGDYLMMSEHGPGEHEDDTFLVGIPMWAGNSAIGAIVARFEGVNREDLRLGSAKADVLSAFGIHSAAALSNAEAYSRTEQYSEVLEGWVEHLSSVMQVTNAISPTLTIDETLSALAKATAAVLGVDECAIFLEDRGGGLVARCCCGGREKLGRLKLEQGECVTGKAFVQGRAVACSDASKSRERATREFCAETEMRGVLSAPLIVEDRPIGAITVYDRLPHQFTAEEIRRLTSISLHASVIVRNASLYTREYSIAEALQKGLLSETPDTCKGLRFAGRYMPAFDEARVGGDFYDVAELPDGTVGIVIGDVSGKGLQAAIHLAACKYMIKALMCAHPGDPGLVLSELNEAINHYFDLSFFVTMFYGIIDTCAGTITYANAGHPPPILVSQDGRLHDCLMGTGIPVGSGTRCDYGVCRTNVEPSDVLLLYTDGVIESRRGGEMLNVEGLHDIVFQAGRCMPWQLIDYVCDQLQTDQGSSQMDDIALLAVSFDGISATPKNAFGGFDEQHNRLTTQAARC